MEYTNSPLVTYKNITKNKSKGRKSAIDTITIHCYVGQVTAKQGCDYFATTSRQVSANYVVGKDGSIGLSVEEKDRAWTSSSPSNDHRAVTIEVACDTKAPYKVTDKAYKSLINLVADICKRNNIKELKWKGDKSLIGKVDKQNMTVHRWFSATACPGEYLYDKHSDIAKKVNEKLKVKKETTTKKETKKSESFLPSRGYFKKGDVSPNVGKIATFMRKNFPSYTSEKALGNTYGDNLIKAVKEFQKRTGLKVDGYFGKLTLAELKKYGFKE